jgi:hypothetical protein
VPVKINGNSASSDPDREPVTEPPDGIVPSISQPREGQTGQVRSLFFQKPDDQALVDAGQVTAGLRRSISTTSRQTP